MVWGKASDADVDLSALWASPSAIKGGYSVAGAGDVNGDGLADIVVGANLADGEEDDAGRAYVVFGVREAAGT